MADALKYLEFCDRIGVKLTPAQAVIGAVSYDGVEPFWLQGRDRDLARTIYGDLETIPEGARGVALNLCGARGGKSYILGATRLVHLSLTVSLDSLAPGEIASAMIVAPNLKLSRQTYRFAVGIAQHPSVRPRIVGNPTKDSFLIAREHGRRVILECLPASRGGAALRARNYVGADLDEFAFFRDGDFQVNDAEIFRAVTPRILPGGQTIITSTAWARKGMMFELFRDNWGKSSGEYAGTCVTARAPTLLLNPSKRAEISIERARDEENAKREFDCEFMDSAGVMFFSHDAIERAVIEGRKMGLLANVPLKPPPGSEIMIGADLGFRRDSSAIVVVYKLRTGEYVVAEVLELKPQTNMPLKPSEVVEAFAAVCKRHEATWLMGDSHYRETLDEELAKHGLSFVPAPEGASGKALCHMHARAILHGRNLRMPAHGRLVQQMKDLISKPTSGGGISLMSPRTANGGHGDILSALVLALSQRAGQKSKEQVADDPITVEDAIKRDVARHWERYERKRLDREAAEVEAEDMAPTLNQYFADDDEGLMPFGR